MKQEFEILKTIIDELNTTNSSNDKKKVLEKCKGNEFILKIFKYTYSPFLNFHVTSGNLKKNNHLIAPEIADYADIFGLLDDLNERKITGHTALSIVNRLIADHQEYAEIIYNIIDRNLKTRADSTLINRVIPNTVPTFDVALAGRYDEKTAKELDFEKHHYYASHKLDGLRCIAILTNGEITLMSRGGKEFLTLDKVKEDLKKLNLTDVVFDGEICLVDESGKDDFQGIMKQMHRKDHTIPNPKYNIFDFLTLEEFESKTSKRIFSERQKELYDLNLNSNTLSVLDQIEVKSIDEISKMATNAELKGWEGLIIRKDCEYKGKRSLDLLKVKSFQDAEYKVEDIEVGPFRVIDNGKEVEENVMSNVLITHKENRVSVGSGFSLEQRREFAKDPSKIIGKIITVKYFEETIDQLGNFSLRFPTCLHIYEGERTT